MPFKEEVAKLIEAEFLHASFRRLPSNILPTFIEAMQKPLIESVMRHCKGNQVKAADALGINRNTLRKYMREYGLSQIDYYVGGTNRYHYTDRITY